MRAAAQEADDSASSLASLRAQLVSAVQKEVAARGAAQEMATLLKELQLKLSALADERDHSQAELASLRQRATREEQETVERTRQLEASHSNDLMAAKAAATREQLTAAQLQEVCLARVPPSAALRGRPPHLPARSAILGPAPVVRCGSKHPVRVASQAHSRWPTDPWQCPCPYRSSL